MRFEEMRYGLLRPVIAPFFHWSSVAEREELGNKDLTLKNIKENQLFYVCDDVYSWASPWLDDAELYEVDVHLAKPFPLFEQFDMRERMDDVDVDVIKKGGFDSVVYTPHPFGRGYRELCLLYPKKQIVGIRKINDVHKDFIVRRKDLQHDAWSHLHAIPKPSDGDAFHAFMEKLKKSINKTSKTRKQA
jgi:hypothetical protein